MSLADALRAAAKGAPLPKGLVVEDAIRRYKGTDSELAAEAGVSRATVTRAKGGGALDPKVIAKLARVLGLPRSAFKVRKGGWK